MINSLLEGPKKEEFFDGVYLIHQIDPGFKNTSLINPKTHQFYTADLIIRSVEEFGLTKDAINMVESSADQVDEETTELVENGAKINNVDFGDKVVLKKLNFQ